MWRRQERYALNVPEWTIFLTYRADSLEICANVEEL